MIAGSELIKRVSEKYGLDEATVKKVWHYLFNECIGMLLEEAEEMERKAQSEFFNGKMEVGVQLLSGLVLKAKKDKSGDWKLKCSSSKKLLKPKQLPDKMILIYARKSSVAVKTKLGKLDDLIALTREGYNVIVLNAETDFKANGTIKEVKEELKKAGIDYDYFTGLKERLGRKGQSKALYT